MTISQRARALAEQLYEMHREKAGWTNTCIFDFGIPILEAGLQEALYQQIARIMAVLNKHGADPNCVSPYQADLMIDKIKEAMNLDTLSEFDRLKAQKDAIETRQINAWKLRAEQAEAALASQTQEIERLKSVLDEATRDF